MTQLDTLLESTTAKLNKAIGHLEISYGRALSLDTNPEHLSEYEDERLARLFLDVRNQTPLLTSLKEIINK